MNDKFYWIAVKKRGTSEWRLYGNAECPALCTVFTFGGKPGDGVEREMKRLANKHKDHEYKVVALVPEDVA